MEYVMGLFDDRTQADRATEPLRRAGVARTDYSATDRGNTFRGWFERLFGMGEDASTLAAHGIPEVDARWFDEQIDRGATLVAVRTDRDVALLGRLLRDAGAHGVHAYGQRQGRWVPVSDDARPSQAARAGEAPEQTGAPAQRAYAPATERAAQEPPVAPDRRPMQDVITGGAAPAGVSRGEVTARTREELEAENARLKTLVGEQALEIERLRAGSASRP
jgi:hypothetical protein